MGWSRWNPLCAAQGSPSLSSPGHLYRLHLSRNENRFCTSNSVRKVKKFSSISEVPILAMILKRTWCPAISTIDSPSRIQTEILLSGTSSKCQDVFYKDSAGGLWSRLIFCCCLRVAQLNTWYCWSESVFSRFKLAGGSFLKSAPKIFDFSLFYGFWWFTGTICIQMYC